MRPEAESLPAAGDGARCQKFAQALYARRDSLSVERLFRDVRSELYMHARASNLSVHLRSSGVREPGVCVTAVRYASCASCSRPVASKEATRRNEHFAAQTSSHPSDAVLELDFDGPLPFGSALSDAAGSSCNQYTSARHALAQYTSSEVLDEALIASWSFGMAEPRPCMLDSPDEEAEVGRCDAEAICASVRAVRVKPREW